MTFPYCSTTAVFDLTSMILFIYIILEKNCQKKISLGQFTLFLWISFFFLFFSFSKMLNIFAAHLELIYSSSITNNTWLALSLSEHTYKEKKHGLDRVRSSYLLLSEHSKTFDKHPFSQLCLLMVELLNGVCPVMDEQPGIGSNRPTTTQFKWFLHSAFILLI